MALPSHHSNYWPPNYRAPTCASSLTATSSSSPSFRRCSSFSLSHLRRRPTVALRSSQSGDLNTEYLLPHSGNRQDTSQRLQIRKSNRLYTRSPGYPMARPREKVKDAVWLSSRRDTSLLGSAIRLILWNALVISFRDRLTAMVYLM